jgi:hypothetical protein
MKEIPLKAKLIISFSISSCFATRWPYWQNYQRDLVDESGVSSVDIIAPWFSMLIYQLGDEQ